MKLLVKRAENGVIYSVDVTGATTVEQLKEALVSASKIPSNNQILLCDGEKLERNQTLSVYGLPSNEKHLFLFDRKALEPDSPPPEEVVLPPVELQIQPAPPLPRSQELEKSPLLWALMKYENQFLGHLNTAEAIKKVVEARTNICKSLITEQENQVKGLEAAIANMDEHYNQISGAYTGFKSYYIQLFEKHKNLLQYFESDMQKLRETTIHPALATSGVKTLMDFVPEARLRKWAEECASEHEQLATRVAELDKHMQAVIDGVEVEKKRPPDVNFQILLDQLKKAESFANEAGTRLQMFVTDYKNVKERVEKASNNKNEALWSLCDGFEDIQKVHSQHLSLMNKYDETMKSITTICAASKTKLTRCLHERLRTIAFLQSKIRDLANRIIVFHEALMKQKKAFHQLVYVQAMPKTYVASLDEVARRRRFGKRLSAFTAKVSEALTKMREQEIDKRKSFLNTYGRFIPRDLVPGLTGSVPPFEIHFPSFDTTLPAVDNDNVTIEEEEDFTMVLSDEKSPRVQDLEKENEKLISELKQLKSDLGTSQGINSETNDMIYKLKADLVHSQESVTDYTKRIELLESKLSTTYSQMERVEGVAKQYKEKYESTEKLLQDIRMEYLMQSQELTQNTQKLEKQLAESQLELEALRQRLAVNEHKLRECESKEKVMTESGKQIAQRLLDAENALHESRALADNLKNNTVAEMQAQVSTLQNELGLKQQEVNSLRQTVEETERRLGEEATQLKSSLQERESELGALREKQLSLESTVERLTEEKQIVLAELKEQRDRAEQTEALMKESTYQKETQETVLKQENESLNLRCEELVSVVSSLKSQMEKLQEELQDKQEEVVKLTEGLSASQNTIATLQEKVVENDSKIAETTQINKLLNEKIATLEAEQKKLVSQLSQQSEKYQTLEQHYKRVEEKFAAQIQSDQQAIQDLKSQLSESESKLKELGAAKSILEEQFRDISEKFVKSVKQVDTKNKQNNELQTNVNILEKKLAAQNQSESQTIQELKKQLAESETKLKEYAATKSNFEQKLNDLANKVLGSAKQLQTKNQQNTELQNNVTILEKKLAATEEEMKKLQADLEKQVAPKPDPEKNSLIEGFKMLETVLALHNDAKSTAPSSPSEKINLIAQQINTLVDQKNSLLKEMNETKDRMKALELTLNMNESGFDSKPKLASSNFKFMDYAVFLPNKNGHYEAVNVQSPNYYIAGEALTHFQAQQKERAPILGQIIEITEHKATSDVNPYSLPLGTTYYEVIITN